MVILQFNKLIRNKWVWGVFAILVSIAFMAPDEWFRGDGQDRNDSSSRNKLPNVEFDQALYDRCRVLTEDFLPRLQSVQRSPLLSAFGKKDAKSVWKAYAAAVAAKEAGCVVPDAVLAERVKAMFTEADGSFSEAVYRDRVKDFFRLDATAFEEVLRTWMSIEAVVDCALTVGAWYPEMDIDLASRDFTDKFTVQVATFTEDKAKRDAITADDAILEKWYAGHKEELSLPDRYRLSYVKFDADASNVLAKVSVTDEQIASRYESNKNKGMYDIEPATTNDVKTYKPLEEVKGAIEIALHHEAALEWLKSEIKTLVASVDDGDDAVADAFLSSVAEKEGLTVGKSDWFAISAPFVSGFMKSPESQFPGVERKLFDRAVRQLVDYRFAVVWSKSSVWLVELAERSQAHVPGFDEAKPAIGDKALAEARSDAFKAEVEAVVANGVQAVLDSGNVSTNLTFSPCSFARDYAMGWFNRYGEWNFSDAGFPYAEKVVFAAHSLAKGEVGGFVPVGGGKGIVVVCNDRKDGDPADLMRGERFARMVAMRNAADFEGWLDWNLERLGYTAKTTSRDSDEDAE